MLIAAIRSMVIQIHQKEILNNRGREALLATSALSDKLKSPLKVLYMYINILLIQALWYNIVLITVKSNRSVCVT